MYYFGISSLGNLKSVEEILSAKYNSPEKAISGRTSHAKSVGIRVFCSSSSARRMLSSTFPTSGANWRRATFMMTVAVYPLMLRYYQTACDGTVSLSRACTGTYLCSRVAVLSTWATDVCAVHAQTTWAKGVSRKQLKIPLELLKEVFQKLSSLMVTGATSDSNEYTVIGTTDDFPVLAWVIPPSNHTRLRITLHRSAAPNSCSLV